MQRDIVTIQNIVESQLKKTILRIEDLGGGGISNAAVVTFVDQIQVFLKWQLNAPPGLFSAEAAGLEELRKAQAIKIPQVIAVCDQSLVGAGISLIILEYLPRGRKSRAGEEELGRRLAQLHRVRGEKFGLRNDNFIGHLPQVNSYHGHWPTFFFRNRLLKQAEIGKKSGWIDTRLWDLLAEQEAVICSALAEAEETPSLLHGDLWSGNVYWTESGPSLIDPAVYYGHREADIAFSEMFGGFGDFFYQAYQEVLPLAPGYIERKRILNLYHEMTHANMFGGNYISAVTSTLRWICSRSS